MERLEDNKADRRKSNQKDCQSEEKTPEEKAHITILFILFTYDEKVI